VIYHNGHETVNCTANYDGVVDYFNELGTECHHHIHYCSSILIFLRIRRYGNVFAIIWYFDSILQYCLKVCIGCNSITPYGEPYDHEWFRQWEEQGEHVIRYFIEPVVLTINYACKSINAVYFSLIRGITQTLWGTSTLFLQVSVVVDG
jgi:hypothetical protein